MKIETVAIKADNDYGYKLINRADLKEDDVVISEEKPKRKYTKRQKTDKGEE